MTETKLAEARLWVTPDAIDNANVDVLRLAYDELASRVGDYLNSQNLRPLNRGRLVMSYEVETVPGE